MVNFFLNNEMELRINQRGGYLKNEVITLGKFSSKIITEKFMRLIINERTGDTGHKTCS